MDKKEQAQLLSTIFANLKEDSIKHFSRIVNKLLECNYLTRAKESDSSDYYFIIENWNLFVCYFALIDMELKNYEVTRTVVLKSINGNHHKTLKKLESIVLLILRLIYEKKMKEVSLSENVTFQLEEFHEEMLRTNVVEERMKVKEITEIMTFFKSKKIIDYKGNDFKNDDMIIVIYPTILYAVNIGDLNKIVEKLESYRKEENNEIFK